MVRPTSSVWSHFIVHQYCQGSKKTARCKYCDKKYLAPNATKMAKHLEKCRKKPIVVSVPVFIDEDDTDEPSVIVGSQEVIMESDNIPDHSVSGSSTYSSIPDVTPFSLVKESPNRPVLKSFFDSMSNDESKKLESALAKAVFSSNSPLSLMENYYFQQFLKSIRPSFKIPTRHDLTYRLLDKEYEEVMQNVNDQVRKADFVSIVTDGWSNIRNEGIVSYVVTTPAPFFYKSLETKENRHTAEYIAEEIINVINEIGEQKITALVTDNARNMTSAWELVKAQYPHIFTIGCSAHGLNLLLSDICKIKTFQLIISNAKEVVKYIKNRQAVLSVFTSKQKLKRGLAASTLKLPAETRWCSNLIMFESLLNGKESLQETVLIEELNIDKEIRKLVLDNDIFWGSVNSLVNVLKPICTGITTIESDNATLSDVPYAFSCVKRSLDSLVLTPLQREEEEEVRIAVEARRKMFCQPIHYATYVLDPRYFENDLDTEEFKSAVDFIGRLHIDEPSASLLADLAQYKSRDAVYSNETVWESAKLLSPLVWWKGFFKGQCLSSVALRLFNIPPSTAACERIFSAFSLTHTSVRNRLNNDRVSKLVSVRSNLILKSKHLPFNNIESDE